MVERVPEEHDVDGSIPSLGTNLKPNVMYPTKTRHWCGAERPRLWYIWKWDFGERYNMLHCYRCGKWWSPRSSVELERRVSTAKVAGSNPVEGTKSPGSSGE